MRNLEKGLQQSPITIMEKIQWLTCRDLCQSLHHNNYFPYLLQLKKRARLNKAVQLIPLPTSDYDPKPGTTCTVAGWGQTRNYPRKPSDTLREVNITVISRQICNDKHHYKNNPVITDNMICAGAKNGGKDSCSVSIFTVCIHIDYNKNKIQSTSFYMFIISASLQFNEDFY